MHPFYQMVGGERAGSSQLVGRVLRDEFVQVFDALDASLEVRASEAFVA